MKTRRGKARRKRKPLASALSEDRILKLSNDLAEDMRSGSVEDWRAVARYWQNQHERVWNDFGAVRDYIAATVCGVNIYQCGMRELKAWLDRQTPTSTA